MKALIFDGKVVQIEAQEFPVAPELVWIDITDITPQPEIDWAYDGNVFTAPPPPPPPLTVRQQIIARLRADPLLKAQVIDSFEARGITDKQAMLAALEAKYADTI